ncbi:MAG TPA: NAD(+) diphosphatase [Bacteroidales bacterium]|nr:MAG: NADH pyrophosphatase [Bacteroidetes bacterium GWE2_42_24]OFY31774.1 MAG: NADH pyrophosphatase [Bacteroidetes bacterium GWF2_43_11]HAQ64363.1 NAD(+) diphosphatase [Bacteroidales bacterium]HBZ65872.1 NAD(+) diphosphatase [Bacteroidales bacterium]
MIQEIFPHRFNNQYRPNCVADENDFILHFNGNALLLKARGNVFEIPRRKDFPGMPDQPESTFLFTLNEVPCFLIWDDPATVDPSFVYKEISFFRTIGQREIGWICIAGYHLMSWYSQNRFCGKCGKPTVQKPDERAIQCPACNSIVYPKISPAVIVAITSNDKILLARNSDFPDNWYSLIAGYVDVGESLEETLKREVKEEVGLDIKNIRYYKSQPWPPSGSLMVGYIAEADENQPISIDHKEIAAADWFSRGNLPKHSLNVSIAGEMIEKFESGQL